MNKILDVFASYADAYLIYWNDFISIGRFCEYYNVDVNEFKEVYDIKHRMPDNLPICTLDYFVSRERNIGKHKYD